MNKVAVAKAIVKLAKEISADSGKKKADYGDLVLYMNVFDMFDVPDELSSNLTDQFIRMVQDAASDIFYSKQGKDQVARALQRDRGLVEFAKTNGIRVKVK